MYKYQTQILIEKNFDFSIVSPEKQKMLSEINGFDFSLIDIVQYLKKQSKNFTEQNPMLEAIDKAIVRVIEKSSKDLGTPNPLKPQAPEKEEKNVEQKIREIEDLIEVLNDIKDDNEEAQLVLEVLEDTLSQLKLENTK